MLSNLHRDLQWKKLYSLHTKIFEQFDIAPRSFRAGRYGMNNDMAFNLERLHYLVDSSITPFVDWRYFYGPDFSSCTKLMPYRFTPGNLQEENQYGRMTEVPLTGGFYQSNFQLANQMLKLFKRKPFKLFRLVGLFSKLGLLNLVRLSPEGYGASQMIKLISVLVKKKIHVLNLSFHSNSLLPGYTPFVSTEVQFRQFLRSIEEVIIHMQDLGFSSITLSEARDINA